MNNNMEKTMQEIRSELNSSSGDICYHTGFLMKDIHKDPRLKLMGKWFLDLCVKKKEIYLYQKLVKRSKKPFEQPSTYEYYARKISQ